VSKKRPGGADIRADSVEIGGDIVGRDKLIYQLVQEVRTEELTLHELIDRVKKYTDYFGRQRANLTEKVRRQWKIIDGPDGDFEDITVVEKLEKELKKWERWHKQAQKLLDSLYDLQLQELERLAEEKRFQLDA